MLEFQPKCLPQEMKKTTADVKKKVQKLSNSKCCRIFSIVLAPTWATDDYYIIQQEIELFSENCYNPKVPELQYWNIIYIIKAGVCLFVCLSTLECSNPN